MLRFIQSIPQLTRLGLASLAAFALTIPCTAQRQPLVMAHGIRSGADTWDLAAFALTSAFPITVRRVTTLWETPYLAQANGLLNSVFAGLPDTTLAVGHSNGGIVLRQAALLNAPMRGLATIGSPNFGAPTADAIRKNYMSDLVSPIFVGLQSMSYALWPPDLGDADEQWYFDYVIVSGLNIIDLINSILVFAGFDPSFSIWNGAYPTSPFMQEVDSASSLALQAQRAPIRASIRTFIDDPQQSVWRLAIAQPNVAYFEAIRDVASLMATWGGLYYTDKYCFLQPNILPGRCNASSLFFDVALDLQLIEGRYCYKMTFEDAAGPFPFPCFATDAVVPLERQQWGPTGYAQPYEIQGPSHAEQTKSQAVINSVETFLQDRSNVARCGTGPVYQVQIAPQSGDLVFGSTTPLALTSLDRCLATVASPPPISSVTSSNPTVATVSIGGGAVNVHALATGVTTISVVVNGISATRAVAVGPGMSLAVVINGGPRENLITGETVWLNAHVSPSGQSVTYAWRVDGGAVMSTSASYGHYFQGTSTISVTVAGSDGQTAAATAHLSGNGTQFRGQRTSAPASGRP